MKIHIKNSYTNILFILLIILVIFIPLYPKFPLFPVQGTYVSIRLEDFLITGTIIFWAIYCFLYKKEIIKNVYFQAFLLFWLTGLVSVLSGVFVLKSVIPHLGLLHWVRRIEIMLLFWLSATAVITKKQLKILLYAFIFTTIAVVFYGFGQLFLGFKVISTVDKDFSTGIMSTLAPTGRVNSTFAGQYDLAIYLSFFLISMTGLVYYAKKIWQRILIITVSVPSFILLAYTASRISFIATIAGITLLLFLLNKKKMIIALIIFCTVVVIAVPQFRNRIVATINVNFLHSEKNIYIPKTTTGGADSSQNDKIKRGLPRDIAEGESTNYTELEVGRSANIRIVNEWPRAMNAFTKNPLVGTGYSSITLATDNDYLRALGETGIIGFTSLGFIFFILLKTFLKINKNSGTQIIAIIIICIMLDAAITGIFIDLLEASKIASIFWIILGTAYNQSTKKAI